MILVETEHSDQSNNAPLVISYSIYAFYTPFSPCFDFFFYISSYICTARFYEELQGGACEYVVYRKEHQDVIPIMGIIVIFGYQQARCTAVFFDCILEE